MLLSFYEWLYLLVILILLVFFTYIIGYFSITLFNRKNLEKIQYTSFEIFTIGLVFIVSCIAIIRTLGNTLFITIPLLWFIHKIIFSEQIQFNFITSIKLFMHHFHFNRYYFLEILLLIIFLFIFQTLTFYNPDGKFVYVGGDYGFYARLAEYIYYSGVESSLIDYFGYTKGVAPYHYGELWLTGFIQNLTSLNVHYVYILGTRTFLLLLICIGIKDVAGFIIKRQKKPFFLNYIYYVIPLFVGGTSIFYPNSVSFLKQDIWTGSPLSIPKLHVIYIFFLWLFMIIVRKEYHRIYLITHIVAVFYSTTVLVLYASIFLFTLYLYYSEVINLNNLLKYTYTILISIFLLTVFYLFNGLLDGGNTVNISLSAFSLVSLLKQKGYVWYLKTMFNIFTKTFIQIIICNLITWGLLIFILISKKNLWRQNNHIIVFTLILFFFSLIGWVSVFPLFDSVQIWSNVYLPSINILSMLIFLYSFENFHYFVSIGISIFLLIVNNPIRTIQQFNKHIPMNEIDSLKKFINSPDKSIKFVFFKDRSEYPDIFEKAINVYPALYPLAYITKPYVITCMSVFEIPISNELYKDVEQLMIQNSSFYQFVLIQKKNNTFISIEDSQIEFIKKHNINFIIQSPNYQFSSKISSLLGNYIVTMDGWKIYKVK